MQEDVVTAMGTPNIALVKYWGKRNEELVLPYNSSVSITLEDKLNTRTSVMFSNKIKSDMLYINNQLQKNTDPDIRERFRVVNDLRKLANTDARILVVSKNSFPSSTGLASSASGVATLVYAASKALGLGLSDKDLSMIARKGSGSASRSLFGGFVKWNKGKRSNGSDSYAEQVASAKHWPDILDVIAIVSRKKKKVSSRAGMRQTVQSSNLYKMRPDQSEYLANKIIKAIKGKDFETLAEITMRDSNSMHATMMDTWPPIFYLNDVSRDIVYMIHELNDTEGKNVAAYTFDAGPNAHIITIEKYKQKVLKSLKEISGIEEIIEAGPGNGPRVIKESLIDEDKILTESFTR